MTDARIEYRAYTPDLEMAKTPDGRTITGIAVPYGLPMRIDSSLIEQFRMGSAGKLVNAPHRMRFSRDHLDLGGDLIGRAVELRDDDPAGLWGAWRVSKTPKGDDTLELFKDGAIDELSVAFWPREDNELPGGITERVRVQYQEVAMVINGAYGRHAVATGLRSAGAGGALAEPEREVIEVRRGSPYVIDTPARDALDRLIASMPLLPALPTR